MDDRKFSERLIELAADAPTASIALTLDAAIAAAMQVEAEAERDD